MKDNRDNNWERFIINYTEKKKNIRSLHHASIIFSLKYYN